MSTLTFTIYVCRTSYHVRVCNSVFAVHAKQFEIHLAIVRTAYADRSLGQKYFPELLVKDEASSHQ